MTDSLKSQMPGNNFIAANKLQDNHTAISGKLEMLEKLLEKFRSQQCLLFSYSTVTLDIIEKFIQSTGRYSGGYLRLDGGTNTANRDKLVKKFQSDKTQKIFLISTKAGGMGLNLTSASKVIIYDVNWNPSYDEQAMDRAFRIGQKKNVHVYR
tara:strand:+ start:858 stop:1316 length:459 start_codon:yes stop_codon:yes gene_type:complete